MSDPADWSPETKSHLEMFFRIWDMGWQASRKQAGWRPIATAPDGQLVVVLWLDKGDIEHPERHAFDFKDEGIWRQHSEDYEHYLCVGGAMGPGPSEQAPYTHWMPLPQPPAMQKD